MSSLVLSAVSAGGFHRCGRRAFWQLLLASAVCTALARMGSAEVPKYLPDHCNLVLSIHFDELYDSPYYQKLKTDISTFASGEKSFQEEIGLAPSNLAQVTMAGDMAATGRESGPIVSIRTRNPVSAADLKAARKVRDFQKDFSYNKIPVGGHTIYEATYRYSWDQGKGELQHSEAFVVMDANTVLFGGNGEALRKVLARDKAPEISTEFQTALNAADFTKTVTEVIDFQAIAGNEAALKTFNRSFGFLFGPSNDELLKKLQSASFNGSLKGSDAQFRGSLVTKDGSAAEQAKKNVADAKVQLHGMLEKQPRVPKELLDAIDAIKLGVDGATVTATGEVKADAVVQWITDEYNYQKKQMEERAKERQKKQSEQQEKSAPAAPVEK